MDFTLSEEQRAFQDTARQFAADQLAPFAAEWDEDKVLSGDALKAAAALGFAGIYIKEDVGGSGLGRLDAALIFEALSAGCTATAAMVSIHNMASWMIDCFGSDDQRQAWLPQLTSMDKLASYCLTEPGSGSDAASLAHKSHQAMVMIMFSMAPKPLSLEPSQSDVYVCMVRTGEAGL